MSFLCLERADEIEALSLDAIVTAPEAVRHLGMGVTPRIISRWVQLEHVTPVGRWRGRPLYRYGDLVHAECYTRTQTQRSHRRGA